MAAGDSWLAKGANVLMFGPPGGGTLPVAATWNLIQIVARVLSRLPRYTSTADQRVL